MENSQENTTFILADVKVFDFLKEKAGDRKTKTEIGTCWTDQWQVLFLHL